MPEKSVWRRSGWFALAVGVAVVVAATFVVIRVRTGSPPPEPTYQGMALREWIGAEPHMRITSHDDIMSYRRRALQAMGKPAVKYLQWVISHPGQSLAEHVTSFQRLQSHLPRFLRQLVPRRFAAPRYSASMSFRNVVIAIELLGPTARSTVPDLVRLWDSDGNPAYSRYGGFPLALGAVGDASPTVIGTLHRHLTSTDALDRSLCAFALWQLKPKGAEEVARLRAKLNSGELHSHIREALLEKLGGQGPTAAVFAAEIRAAAATEPGRNSAFAAWRVLNEPEAATSLMRSLGAAAMKPDASKKEMDEFSADALHLAEVPGVSAMVIPVLKEISLREDASVARFASNILKRVEAVEASAKKP